MPTHFIVASGTSSLASNQIAAGDTINVCDGDGASFGQFDGATNGINTITIGDDFTSDKDWKLGNNADSLTIGNGADMKSITSEGGDDRIRIGDDGDINEIDTKSGNDALTVGDNFTAGNVKMGDGNDSVYTGPAHNVSTWDGGSGFDTFTTEASSNSLKNFESFQMVCFATGMFVETAQGAVAVEALREGDMISTADEGYAPVLWARSRNVPLTALYAQPRLRPICISANALGPGMPDRDLVVSPQHRILLRSPIVLRMFGSLEIFAPAKALLEAPGIVQMPPEGPIAYHHILLPRHHVIFSQGVATESLLLDGETLKTLSRPERMALGLRGVSLDGKAARPARPCPGNMQKLRHLVARHVKNRRALVAPHTERLRLVS